MKKNFIAIMSMALCMCVATSCGSSKPVASVPATDIEGRQKLQESECELMSRDNKWRAFSVGQSPDKAYAYSLAIQKAKAILTRNIDYKVIAGDELNEGQNQAGGEIAKEEETLNFTKTLTEVALKECKVICSGTYKIASKNLYETEVCIEVPSEVQSSLRKKMEEHKKELKK